MGKSFQTYLLLFFIFFTAKASPYGVDGKGIVKPMSPPQLVNDFSGILNESERQSLENKLLDYNDSTSTQIYIVTIDSLKDLEISEYALEIGRSWGIGQKGENNGILILVSKHDRKVDIEVGYGLESFVTDYDSKHIIDELIAPAFRQNNYFKGLDDATDKLISLLQGTPYKGVYGKTKEEKTISIVGYILIILFILFLLIRFPLARSIAYVLITSAGSRSGSSRGFGGGGGGSFGGGGSSGSW